MPKCSLCSYETNVGADLQSHFQSDWHSFNSRFLSDQNDDSSIKNPLSYEQFLEYAKKMQSAQSNIDKANEKIYCKACEKYLKNSSAYQHHISTNVHLKNQKIYDEELAMLQNCEYEQPIAELDDEENAAEDLNSGEEDENIEDVEVNETICLFCFEESEDLVSNFEHMKLKHGMIPSAPEYVTDLAGLFFFYARLMFENCLCLSCGREFEEPTILQKHMRVKNHFNLDIENIDFAEFIVYYKFPGDDDMYLFRPKFTYAHNGQVFVNTSNRTILTKSAARTKKLDTARQIFENRIAQIKASRPQLMSNTVTNSDGSSIKLSHAGSTYSSIVSYVKSRNHYHKIVNSDKDHHLKQLRGKTSNKAYRMYTMRMRLPFIQ